jgi:hypothetical protein
MTYEVVISEAATETFQDIRIQVENRWGQNMQTNLKRGLSAFWK